MDNSFEFQPGETILFILAIFSTVVALVPFVESSTTDSSATEIFRLQAITTIDNKSALSIIDNKSPDPADKLIRAYEQLHDSDGIRNYYEHHRKSAEANLAMAAVVYNIGSNIPKMGMANYIQAANTSKLSHTVNNELLYTNRKLNLENETLSPKWKEDSICPNNGWQNTCPYSKLKQIEERLADLARNGWSTANFYNNDKKVHAVQNSVDTFISDLNHFMIISFIAGPIVFFVGTKVYLGRKRE